MQFGHKMIVIALRALGLAGLMNSTGGILLGMAGSALSGKFAAAGAIGLGSLAMTFLVDEI